MQYHLSWNNNIYGPCSREEVRNLYERKMIPAGAFISVDNGPWQTFEGGIIDAAPKMKCPPPPLTKPGPPRNMVAVSQNFIPWGEIFSLRFIKKKSVMLVLIFAGLPFLILAVAKFTFVIWGIYFCLVWAGVFCLLLRPSEMTVKSSIRYGLFTALIGIPFLLLAQRLPVISSFYDVLAGRSTNQNFFRIVTGFILGVGVCEELTKILPLVLFARKKICSVNSFIFMGIISGFGFAVAENIDYGKRCGLQMRSLAGLSPEISIVKYAELLSIQLLRFISLPLFHAAWSGIFAWFVCNYFRKKDFSYFWMGLFFTAILHGVYDASCMISIYLSFAVGITCVYLLLAFFTLGSHEGDDILNLKLNLK